jgi:hypothetical protein
VRCRPWLHGAVTAGRSTEHFRCARETGCSNARRLSANIFSLCNPTVRSSIDSLSQEIVGVQIRLSGLRTLRLNAPDEVALARACKRLHAPAHARSCGFIAFFATWGCVASGFREADASSNLLI